MVARQLATALGRGALRRVIPDVGPSRVVPAAVSMARRAAPGELRASAVAPVVPPGTQTLPTWFQGGVRSGSPVGFGSGESTLRGGLPRTGEDIAAARGALGDFTRRQAAAGPARSPSLGSTPRPTEGQVLREEAAVSGVLGRGPGPARKDITSIVNPDSQLIDSYTLSAHLLHLAPTQVAFGNAIKRVRLLRMDPKMGKAQQDSLDDMISEIAKRRFGLSASDDIVQMANPSTPVATGTPAQLVRTAQSSAENSLKNATTPEDMTNIYNFVVRTNALEDPTFRFRFLVAFQKQLDNVGRAEVRRILGTGQALEDDVALAVWQNISGGGLRSATLLQSVRNPKNTDYANAIRTSYTKKELDDVAELIRENAPKLTPAQYDELRGLYAGQQELIGKNAFNRVQKFLDTEQGAQLKVMSSEVKRIIDLPPGPYKPDVQMLRSRTKGVRKATDESASVVGGPTGGMSFRGAEGEVSVGMMRTNALNTQDLHASYATRAYLNRKAREESNVFVAKSVGEDVGSKIVPVTYAEAGLRQPYIVGKVNENVRVNMARIGRAQKKKPKAGETADDFASRLSSSGEYTPTPAVNIKKLSPDTGVDRVFLRNLKDDLTLKTRPDSDFAIMRLDSNGKYVPTGKYMNRGGFTKASEGLPDNIPVDQVDDFIKTLDLRELQRLEQQFYVDRYGYRLLHEVRYARSITELDSIAERVAAGYAAGMTPKGFYEILKVSMSQRAAMIPSGSRFIPPGQKASGSRRKSYKAPQFKFSGGNAFNQFMDYLSSNVPAGGAARVAGRTGIQFPQ